METVKDFDAAEYIETREDIIAYLDAALAEHDTKFLLKAIGNVARSKGMAQLARELNLSREGLYDSLSPKGNPSFTTVVKVLDNLGFRLSVKQKASA
ncbi:MAG: putative addiction module antidote protein [Treponema sp.]|jgi:probable addiction module antidote protein|nr:putative addiction module antidote protein [Treponema sp.]